MKRTRSGRRYAVWRSYSIHPWHSHPRCTHRDRKWDKNSNILFGRNHCRSGHQAKSASYFILTESFAPRLPNASLLRLRPANSANVQVSGVMHDVSGSKDHNLPMSPGIADHLGFCLLMSSVIGGRRYDVLPNEQSCHFHIERISHTRHSKLLYIIPITKSNLFHGRPWREISYLGLVHKDAEDGLHHGKITDEHCLQDGKRADPRT